MSETVPATRKTAPAGSAGLCSENSKNLSLFLVRGPNLGRPLYDFLRIPKFFEQK